MVLKSWNIKNEIKSYLSVCVQEIIVLLLTWQVKIEPQEPSEDDIADSPKLPNLPGLEDMLSNFLQIHAPMFVSLHLTVIIS